MKLSILSVLSALALLPTPVSAQITTADVRLAFERGDPARAVVILTSLLDASPDDPDLLRRLAGAQAATGNYAAALGSIDRARALAPDDLDVRLARARILLWSGDRNGAKAETAAVSAINPAYPDLAETERAISNGQNSRARGGVSGSFGVAGVDTRGGNQAWSIVTVSGYAQLGPLSTLAITAEREQRRTTDTRLSASYDRRIGTASFHIGATITPNADFREQWSVNAGGEMPIIDHVKLLGDIRYARYSNTQVTVVEPGLSTDIAKGRLALTARSIVLFQRGDETRVGALLRSDLNVRGDRSLFVIAATYPDTEAGITRQVRSAAIGGALPLSGRLILRIAGEYEARAQSYTRKAVTFGLSWRYGD